MPVVIGRYCRFPLEVLQRVFTEFMLEFVLRAEFCFYVRGSGLINIVFKKIKKIEEEGC